MNKPAAYTTADALAEIRLTNNGRLFGATCKRAMLDALELAVAAGLVAKSYSTFLGGTAAYTARAAAKGAA